MVREYTFSLTWASVRLTAMPFNEALFWFGLTAFGTGLYALFEPAVKRLYSIGITVIGLLACAYAEYRHYHPEFPAVRLWVILLLLTWAFLGYSIYIRRMNPKGPSKLVIHSAVYGTGPANDIDVKSRLLETAEKALIVPVTNGFLRCDPAPNEPKRLRVTYSYGTVNSWTIEGGQDGYLFLPPDPQAQRLENEVERLTNAQKKGSEKEACVAEWAGALGALPVYRQDLRVELLAVYSGTTWSSLTTVFFLIKTWAERDLNMIGLSVRLSTSEGVYDGQVLSNLSKWMLSEQFFDTRFNMTNRKETNMESPSLSLMNEIESGIFREGHHPAKWIACTIPPEFLTEKQVTKIKIKFHDKDGIAKSEVFDEWPETSFRILDVEFNRSS